MNGHSAEDDAGTCEYYDQPGQDCFTAGMEVIAAEGLCGPCAMRLMTRATPPGVHDLKILEVTGRTVSFRSPFGLYV